MKTFFFQFSICGFHDYFNLTRVTNFYCIAINYHFKQFIGTSVTSSILREFLSISNYCHLSCSLVYLSVPFHHSDDTQITLRTGHLYRS